MSTRRVVLSVLAVLLAFGAFFALRPLIERWHPAYRPFMVAGFLALISVSCFRSLLEYRRRDRMGPRYTWRDVPAAAVLGCGSFAAVLLLLGR